jgi:hypothetical protein
MTTFTTEDRINAEKTQELQAEIRNLKIELKHQKERVENWKAAYDKVMDYNKKLLAKGCDK